MTRARTAEPTPATYSVELTEPQLRQLASLAVRSSAWDVLRAVESALVAAELPAALDIYTENADLRRRIRALEEKS